MGRERTLRADFGSGLFAGGPIGIPFVTVPGGQPRVPLTFEYADESDPGPYPIPREVPIEGGAESQGDRHVIVLDRDRCRLYEVYSAYPQADGSWRAGSGAVFDLGSNQLRPKGWTSADAAGLPILPGLVRYEEVAAGEIRHALRFTVPQTERAYLWPARHFASRLTDPKYPPMGAWFRLRADFDVSRLSPPVQVIARALQRYGMILADNGSSWFISGAPDERWRNDILRELLTIRGVDLEAVDVSGLIRDVDSGETLTTAEPAEVRNAASGEAGPIAPGQIVSIYSTNFSAGPGSPIGPTSVLFGDRAAAVLYDSEQQVNVVVPYGITGKVRITVSRGGKEVLNVVSTIAGAAPAIFVTSDGRAASWNDDGAVGATARGKVVSLLGTGDGERDSEQRTMNPVRAWVGGVEAEVLYSGVAPNLPPGVTQVNLRIPEAAPLGLQPVTLRIGAYVSTVGPRIETR